MKDKTIQTAFGRFFQDEIETEFTRLFENYHRRNRSIVIDWEAFHDHNEDVATAAVENPDRILENAHTAFEQHATDTILPDLDEDPDEYDLESGHVRFENAPQRDIRDLRADDINRLVALSGVVSKTTDVKPRLTQTVFECQRCGTLRSVIQPDRSLTEPYECQGCERSGPFAIDYDHQDTEFIDTQTIRLQERPEGLKGGERPRDIDVRFEDDITGEVNAGDRVTVVGILRAEEAPGENKSTVQDVHIEGINVTAEEKDFEDFEITPEDEDRITTLVREAKEEEEEEDRDDDAEHRLIEKVVDSIAPSIYGYREQKKAMAFQLFGGVEKDLPDGSRVRGDIHMLLVGDPGTAKSQLLGYVDKIAPRSVYSSGKGSSSAGLTAAAVQDDFGDGNEWSLEAGALVLADKGLAAIDELDKMKSSDRSAMHEALEQQEISISKAGINATMKSRCSLLGAANPTYGRFDPYEPIGEQIDLEPALISRFDLIFTIRDEPDEEKDSDLADHILNSNRVGELYTQGPEDSLPDEHQDDEEEVEPVIEPDLLRKYVAYAKQITPTMTDEAMDAIQEYYVDLRNRQGDKDEDGDQSPVSITARQLEAIVRLAEASARIKLKEEVKVTEAREAIELVQSTLEDVGYDPETGEFDADRFGAGTTQRERNAIKSILKAIDKLREEDAERDEEDQKYTGKGIPKEDIREKLTDVTDRDFEKELMELKNNGRIYEPEDGCYRKL